MLDYTKFGPNRELDNSIVYQNLVEHRSSNLRYKLAVIKLIGRAYDVRRMLEIMIQRA